MEAPRISRCQEVAHSISSGSAVGSDERQVLCIAIRVNNMIAESIVAGRDNAHHQLKALLG